MRYCDGKKVLIGPNRHRFDFSGSSNMEELKLLMLQRFMIRRLKSEVLSQLPSKQRQMIVLDPNLVKSKSREMQTQARQMSNTRSGAKDTASYWNGTTPQPMLKVLLCRITLKIWLKTEGNL